MMKIKLKQLILGLDIEVRGKKDLEISGISNHSRQVAPGDLFFALKGDKVDGSLYIEEAIRAGAVAVVTDLYNPFLPKITQLICKHPAEYQALIASRFYKDPSQGLYLVGITGTNGKTTTSYLIKHLLEDKRPCGLIGTIETIIQQHTYPSQLTTPDVLFLNKSMHEMHKKGCASCVMEVSSHGLAQKRTQGLEFNVAVFTNLTQDHLDYHKTMEHYGQSKSLLFSQMSLYKGKKNKVALINGDDDYAKVMLTACKHPVMLYGITGSGLDLKAENIHLTQTSSSFSCVYQGKTALMQLPLIGKFNIYNALAAIGVALHAGFSLEQIAARIHTFSCVKGRLEKVPNTKGLSVYVDFAHTDKALESVLKTLRAVTQGKVIVVTGCGGDRDISKRPLMGQAAEAFADTVIFTSDNPRSEDPLEIIKQMQAKLRNPEKTSVEVDRKKAIEKALRLARPQDSVLIAGKGHETTQTFKEKTLHFSDVSVAQEILAK
jgi:UDP-N-acetylmuramoyl-L-alanyl-D-glutamate--2,6-diaminopimelate ligase